MIGAVIPNGWTSCALGDIVRFEYGKALPEKVRDAEGVYPVFGSSGQVGVHSTYIAEGPCIVIGRKGSAGAVTYCRDKCWPIDTTYFASGSQNLDTTFLYFLLKSLRLETLDRSTAIPGLNRGDAYSQPVLLPPIEEQHRIVDKIETLFTQLDQGEASLRSVQTLLTRYRQSVLKAAVTGQLTADWRAENAQRLEHGRDLLQRILQTRRDNWQGRGKYKEPIAPDTSELPELPEGWVWASLDALITDGPTNGLSPKESSTDNAVPSFKLTATTSGTFVIDESTVKYVGADVPPNSKYWLQSGDILIQRGNTIDYVGTAAIFPGPNNTYIYPDLMMRIRVAFPELGVWLATWTNFEYAKRHFRRLATGTAGNMPKINGTTLKSLPVPIPSELEIQKINDEITSLESRYHHLVDCYRDELSRSASLRQSILKDAFAGRLIPQDPNDEPASALLARIRAEREADTQSTRPTRSKPTGRKAGSKQPQGSL